MAQATSTVPRSFRRGEDECVMPQERISDVVVMHADAPLRVILRLVLAEDGYAVVEAPSYAAALRHLYAASGPMVVVAGNWEPDYRAEMEFFGHVASDPMLPRHRFVLLSTIPEWMPPELEAMLRRLEVPVLRMPAQMRDLLAAVASVGGQRRATAEPAG